MAFDINGIVLSSPAGGTTFAIDSGVNSWLRIDSSGRMTREKPVFYQGTFNSQGANYMAYPVIPGTVVANYGGAWNASTGLFTCPIAGRYIAGMNGIASSNLNGNGASYGYFSIMKNGAVQVFSHWNTSGYWGHVSESCILDCAVGDTIAFSINTSPGVQASPRVNGFYAQGNHGNFWIGLLK